MSNVAMKAIFKGRVLWIGYGSVSKCLSQLLLRHLDMDYSKLTIIDPIDYRAEAKDLIYAGATYKQIEVTQSNMRSVLEEHVGAGDLVIDLSVNVGSLSVASWCFQNDVMYLNTSLEEWGIHINNHSWSEDTLYRRHFELGEHMEMLGTDGPTVVVEHGCNPGLASHWTKLALEDLAEAMLKRPVLCAERRLALEDSLESQDFARIAMLTGTKVVHISERDTQAIGRARKPGEFLNTWSPDGFYQESLSIAEVAWGTHEKTLPSDAIVYDWGPKNQISIRQRALDVTARSWIPSGEIEGTVIPHGETYTISQKLTLKRDGKVVYRPSVYFVYNPPEIASESLLEYADSGKDSPDQTVVMNTEIVSGVDEVGILLLGHDLGGWWTGSRLSIDETRKHVKDQNATVLQVAASVLGALFYMVRNPRKGFRRVEELPHREILAVASAYLGDSISMQTDWSATPGVTGEGAFQFADYRTRASIPACAVGM